jgi:hypothetical protein
MANVDLPTKSVDSVEADAILANFGDEAGYQDWLDGALRDSILHSRSTANWQQVQVDTQNEFPSLFS